MCPANKRRLCLLAIVLVAGYLWGSVLPRWAADPEFRRAEAEFERAGIDATALFYTDHPRAFRSVP